MLQFRELNEKFQDRVKNDYLIHGVKLTEFYKFIENVSFFEYPRLLKIDEGMTTVAVHGLYSDGENEYWFFEGVKDRVNGEFGLTDKVDF